MLVYCWASVADGGPTVNRHWCDVFVLLVVVKLKYYENYAIIKVNILLNIDKFRRRT